MLVPFVPRTKKLRNAFRLEPVWLVGLEKDALHPAAVR